MRNSTNDTPSGPPQDRLWTETDLANFFVFRSVDELIKRHPDFPPPLPLRIHGRRWCPAAVLAWVVQLGAQPAPSVESNSIPEFDITTISNLLEEARHVPTP